MKVFRIAFVVMLILASKSTVVEESASKAQPLSPPAARVQGILPFFVIPDEDRFVVVEEHTLVIALFASCFPDTPDTAAFEFVPPSANFARLLFPFRGLGTSHCLIVLDPKMGDAGKYTVAVKARNCEGLTTTINLTVKVKRN